MQGLDLGQNMTKHFILPEYHIHVKDLPGLAEISIADFINVENNYRRYYTNKYTYNFRVLLEIYFKISFVELSPNVVVVQNDCTDHFYDLILFEKKFVKLVIISTMFKSSKMLNHFE